MTLNRYAKKRDENEPEIIEALESAGCLVMQMDKVDLSVQNPRGEIFLMEIKGPKGKLTRYQAELLAVGWKIVVARDVDDALTGVNVKVP